MCPCLEDNLDNIEVGERGGDGAQQSSVADGCFFRKHRIRKLEKNRAWIVPAERVERASRESPKASSLTGHGGITVHSQLWLPYRVPAAPSPGETEEAYKRRLRRTAMKIPAALIRKAMANIKVRARQLIQAKGGDIKRD